jgi:hypothetical protein
MRLYKEKQPMIKQTPFHKRQLTINLKLKKGISKRARQMIEAYQLRIKQTIYDQRSQKDETKKISIRSDIPNQSTKNESISGDGNKSAQRTKKHAILAQFSPDPIMRFPSINENGEGLPKMKGIRNGDFSCRKRSILNIEDLSPSKNNIKSIL